MAINVNDTTTGKMICKLTGHENMIHGLRFDSSGTFIATYSGGDGTARVWTRQPNGRFLQTALIIQEGIKGIAFDPSGALLALATEENSVSLWHVSEGTLVFRIVGSFGPISSCAFDPRGRLITAFSSDFREASDQHISIWDVTPIDVDSRRLATWVERYTGTKWTPDAPGGVNGLTNAEWKERIVALGICEP